MSFWLVIGVIAWLVIAFWPAQLAKSKGYSFFLFLILSWFVSFVITLIVAALLKDKKATPQSRADDRAVEAVLEKEAKSVES